MLFVQKGNTWNTIQFFYYSLLFLGVISGLYLEDYLKIQKSRFKKLFIILSVVAFTLPTTLSSLKHYLPSTPPSHISKAEIAALDFLAEQPEGIVLSGLFDKKMADKIQTKAPRPLYYYESTAYVSAFSKKQGFLEDEINLIITDYDVKNRKESIAGFFANPNTSEGKQFLKANKITYIYKINRIGKGLDENYLGLSNIFYNEEVIIYRVL